MVAYYFSVDFDTTYVQHMRCDSHCRNLHRYRHLAQSLVLLIYGTIVVVLPLILDVRLVDSPAGATQEEGHTGFLHLPSVVLALTLIARRIQPSLSLVDREVEFRVLTN